MRRARGFTLIEVLVALAVVAVAMAALIKVAGDNTRDTAYLKEKTLAHWVATDKATALQIARAWPAPGRSSGTVVQAQREWRWTVDVQDTADPEVRRAEVSVRPADAAETGAPLARLTAFLGKPQ